MGIHSFTRRSRSPAAVALRATTAALLGGTAIVFAAAAAPARALQVGHTSVTFVDVSRGGRAVLTEIYYPADTAGDDVPVAAGAADLPVVSFGHGFLIPWDAYAYLWEALVPAGYVVALPRTEGGLLPDHQEFGRDLAFVVAALQAEDGDAASRFYQRIGTTSALMGHSMGGGASVLGAAGAPSVTVVANLAAAETNPSAIAAAASVTVPALVLAGTDDCVTPVAVHQRPIYDALASDCAALVQILGAGHCRFAGTNFTCSLGEVGCPTPGISEAAQHQAVLDLLIPWLAFRLRGDVAAGATFQALLDQDPRILAEQDCAAVAAPLPVAPAEAAASLRVSPGFPNPFRGSTRIRFEMDRSGPVTADVLEIGGRRVALLLDSAREDGTHDVVWDGRDTDRLAAPAGVYTVRIRALDEQRAVRVIKLR